MDNSNTEQLSQSPTLQWPSADVIEALQETDLLAIWIGRRLEALVAATTSLEQWKDHHFAAKAQQKFLEMGSALDRVCLSVLQSDDVHLAQEWYFKLQDGDSSFRALAPQSLGNSANSGGHLGPLRLEELSSPLDRLVLRAQPGIIQPPLRIANGNSIVLRLDSRQPAQWDPKTRQELIERLHRSWLSLCIDPLLSNPPAPGSSYPIPQP
jgi:hypothetical protein